MVFGEYMGMEGVKSMLYGALIGKFTRKSIK
jgi:hypothetical protein